MNRSARILLRIATAAIAVSTMISFSTFGQDRDRPRPGDDGPRGDRPPFEFRFGPIALQEALDKNNDRRISAEELKSAVESLRSLDKNEDGKLDSAEIGWPPQFGGPGGRRGGRGGRGGGFGRRGGSAAPADFGKRIVSRDANGDGKVTADELPRSMRRVLEIADSNRDGAIDESEAQKFAQQHGAIGRAPAARSEAQPPAQSRDE